MKMDDNQPKKVLIPHILLIPLPLQSPIKCFLKLSSSDDNLVITIINASFIHACLSDLSSRFPSVRFVALYDGIAGDHPRSRDVFTTMVHNLEDEVISQLHELVKLPVPPTCMIADTTFTRAGAKARELGIAVVYFSSAGPCCVWAGSCLVPALLRDAQLPLTDGNESVTKIPGSDTFLRQADFPSFCQAQDMNHPFVQIGLREYIELPNNAQGLILNTFDDLDGPVLAEMHSLFPNLYAIDPIHLLLKTRLQLTAEEQRVMSSNSFWQEDRTCLAWLDSQPSKSVLFVSFGSAVPLNVDRLIEVIYGLVNSGVRFLWVKRPDSIVGLEYGDQEGQLQFPREVLEGIKEKGFFVSWAPQEEVLAHRAIGGFLTHSGWNSTMESIVEGVPMLCWPYDYDQPVISRFVGNVWSIGIDMKDKCDRVVIENMVRDLMERKKDEFAEKVIVLSKLAAQAVQRGGSSWRAFDNLVEDIKLVRFVVPHKIS